MVPATTASSAEMTDRFILRWSDSPGLPVREEPVEIIRADWPEPIFRSAFPVSEETEVFLIGSKYTGNGIVRSCRKEGGSFILTILINSEYTRPELLPKYDPGLFAVDDFLTEEEEAKILESLKRDSDDLLSRLRLFTEAACNALGLHDIRSSMQLNPQ